MEHCTRFHTPPRAVTRTVIWAATRAITRHRWLLFAAARNHQKKKKKNRATCWIRHGYGENALKNIVNPWNYAIRPSGSFPTNFHRAFSLQLFWFHAQTRPKNSSFPFNRIDQMMKAPIARFVSDQPRSFSKPRTRTGFFRLVARGAVARTERFE